MHKKYQFYNLIFVVVGLFFSTSAWSISVGSGPGVAMATDHFFEAGAGPEGGWIIGTPGMPIEISADPGAGAWIKNLSGFLAPTIPTTYVIHEHLLVGAGPSWTDWHEEVIAGAGWTWSSGSVNLAGGGPAVPGLMTSGLGSSSIWFDFSALAPGTAIDIWKEISCDPNQGPCGNSITISEFPTIVPIPAAMWLFVSGLFGLVGIARKKMA